MVLSDIEEKAIQFYMQGSDKTSAYKMAGYGGNSQPKTITENACRFFKRSKVIARIKEIREKVVEELVIDRKYITQEVLDAIEEAKKDREHNVVLKGCEQLSRMYDLNEDKINDRMISDKHKEALLENFKQRMLDVTPESD